MSSFPITVLHTVAGINRNSGGPSRTVPSLCEYLGAAGVEVHLLSQEMASGEDSNVLPDSRLVNTHLVKTFVYSKRFRLLYAPSFGRNLGVLCRREAIQIIHDHGVWLPTNHSAARVAHRMRIPLVVHPRGMFGPWALNYRRWKKRLAWALYQRRDIEKASLFVAASEQEAESIRKIGLRQPIAVIPNGINLPGWEAHTASSRQIRYALFLSRVHRSKGLINLVKAWAKVQPNSWKMIVAGPNEENHLAEVERAIKNLKLDQVFEFVGPVEGVAKDKLYRNADLFILPTFSENFGVVVAEALSYGVPVITTKGAPWQALITHRCGWWVDPTAEAIAEAIREATSLSDPERQEMGQRGRDFVEREFSWDSVASQVIETYQWLLHQADKPACVYLD